jgi:hypothetical protein
MSFPSVSILARVAVSRQQERTALPPHELSNLVDAVDRQLRTIQPDRRTEMSPIDW